MTNRAASVHQRLLNLAKGSGRPFNELLQYYAIERFLYRLSTSKYRDLFVLKGALTLMVWQTPVTRPTRDIDLLGRISNDLDAVRMVIAEVCQQSVDDDGLSFDSSTVVSERITEDANYEGARVRFQGRMGNARIPMQIDIGFGDVITPAPVPISYPAMLGGSVAELMAYNRETTIAEKLEAMVTLGQLNSRMKDFFDVWLLANNFEFDGGILSRAISQTFARRETQVDAAPICFTAAFASDPMKVSQWDAFIRTARLATVPSLAGTIVGIRAFLEPPLAAVALKKDFSMHWNAPGPWRPV
jgi:predicted nucleotidyltransferase component of viral defense system